ncbi:LysM peptidoglycan-binding domain-containing protein [Primorskyibacter sp. 2E107]|uniref:LysM peptidoglycan-binding domain-containing protein n=1 Tax=Primorskyibacter sp. 2E107 TaxID=3403458 RepID=UPI003AF737A4
MIKQAFLGTGFIAVTLGFLWFGLAPQPQQTPDFNEVSRSDPSLLGLTPAIPQSAPVQPVPKPQGQPERVAAPAPEPKSVPAPVAVADPTPAPTPKPVARGDAMEQLRAMSYGIMQEMKAAKPASPAPAPLREQASLDPAPAPAAPAVAEPQGQKYTVKPGDSLPGIAFRFYGTTVAYFQIIDANPDQLTEPADLKAGMVLTIPGT